MDDAANQTKLVSVRKGTVVKVFQAWLIEVDSIGPKSRPEIWENTHMHQLPQPSRNQQIQYMNVETSPCAGTFTEYVYTKPKCGWKEKTISSSELIKSKLIYHLRVCLVAKPVTYWYATLHVSALQAVKIEKVLNSVCHNSTFCKDLKNCF